MSLAPVFRRETSNREQKDQYDEKGLIGSNVIDESVSEISVNMRNSHENLSYFCDVITKFSLKF